MDQAQINVWKEPPTTQEKETLEEIGRCMGNAAYRNLDDKQKAIIAFGMTPVEVMPEEGCGEDYRKGFVLGLMDAAKAAGKMVA